jgi:hypothetical protein
VVLIMPRIVLDRGGPALTLTRARRVVLRQNQRRALAGHRGVLGIDPDDRDRWETYKLTRRAFGRLSDAFRPELH